ncbi:TNFAIP3-interacting protein 2 isoform X2 [Lingula anatina]|uniref:TNFAIP3-interacting protein 2 isoform X2 n=1 Tax=Lingula anatina TaxID=7574 RepID=A0A1S3I649_LINAN|nr:TNFAIP3-interacting protein 2 isoform X2 [Lingula anatina]|eukprot:XP_013393732.1 TNFAIP3-interacting protein 2 isoform X2 [Lingula anatina]
MAHSKPPHHSSASPEFDLPSLSSEPESEVFSSGVATSPSFEIIGSSSSGNVNKKMKTEGEFNQEGPGDEVHRSISVQDQLMTGRKVAQRPSIERSESLMSLTDALKKQNIVDEEITQAVAGCDDEKFVTVREKVSKLKKECCPKHRRRSTTPEKKELRRSLKKKCKECKDCVAKHLEAMQISQEDTSEQLDELEKLKVENMKLKSQLHKVFEANMKWQVYDSQRDHYVATLMEQLEDLKEKLQQAKSSTNLDEAAQREIDKILLASKDKVTAIEEEKIQLEDDLRKFKQLCEQKEQRIRQLEAQLRERQGGDKDVVEALKQQILLCTEDFEAERRDRERAQGKIFDLETELQLLRRQLEMYEGEAVQSMNSRRQAALEGHAYCPGRTVPDDYDLEEDMDEVDSLTSAKE